MMKKINVQARQVLQANNGCPISDRDKDGINDDEDKCPDVPGQ